MTFNDADKEIRRKWTSALRSGEYTQTFGKSVEIVEGKKCHCAMGVLYEISREDPNARFLQRRNHSHFVPDMYHVIRLNDSMRLSFESIADIIDIHTEQGYES